MIKRHFLILAFLLFKICSYSQTANLDSLELLLQKNPQADYVRVDLLIQASIEVGRVSNETAMKYAVEADSISDLIGYKYGNAESNRLTGNMFINLGDYDKAMNHLNIAMEIFSEIGNSYGLIVSKNSIGTIYSYIGDLNKAMDSFNESLAISEEMGMYSLMTLAYNNIGNIYYFQGDFDSALENYLRALEIRENQGEKSGLSGSYNNIGVIYKLKGDYPKALEYYQKALRIREEFGDLRGVAMSYNNIGVIYDTQGDYEVALEFYEKALELRIGFGDKAGISAGYNNIGHIYQNLGDYENALKFYKESLQIKIEIGDKSDMALSYNNIANAYLALDEFEESYQNFIKAKSLSESIGLKSVEAWSNIGLGELFYKQKKYNDAYKHSKHAYKLANEIGDVKLKQRSSDVLSRSSAKVGFFEEAYNYHMIYKKASDSIRSEENIRKILGLEYEFKHEKEKEVARLEQEKKEAVFNEELLLQKDIRNTFILGFVFSVLLLMLLTYAFMQRKKKNRLLAIQRSLEFKQNFLANMSHEIRTPLTGLVGMIELLRTTGIDEHQMDCLNTISQSTDNLHEIINQILDYSKIESGNVKLNYRAFKVQNLLTNAKNLFESICDKNVSFELIVDEELPEYIFADRGRIKQIINNLMLNAVKYTNKGKISLKASLVKVESASDEIIIRFEVSDTGLGIKKEKFDQIFVPFGQVDESDTRSFDGTGLGLSICKELVRLHGGEIGFESEHKVGSTFWFTFRAKKISKIDASIVNSNEYLKTEKPLNILFVEDKLTTQKVISMMLKSMGHTVTLADNGEHAIQIYKPGVFDLILMDIQMPVMDGVSATKNLKEKHTDLPPVIGLSANAFEGAREKYMSLGMDEYITKPLITEHFLEVVQKVLK